MKKLERLAQAVAPDGAILTLFRHDRDYLLKVNGEELMSTRRHQSEDRLAELACGPFVGLAGVQVLVGGLGFGFTLRATLDLLPADARVVVAEIMSEVIAWNCDPEYGLGRTALQDPRVELVHGDVADLLRASDGRFHAIMLDVDNGADAVVTSGNAGLYRDGGIAAAVRALRPGGRLAYWSAYNDPDFERALRRAGLLVDATRVRAHPRSGPWHSIFVARRANGRSG